MKRIQLALLVAAALPAVLPAVSHADTSAAPQYRITDLGVVSSATPYSQSFGISSNGQYGVGRNLQDQHVAVVPWPTFIWSASTGMQGQAGLEGHDYGWGYAVNNSGVAVGVQAVGNTGSGALPTMWVNGQATQLAMPAGQTVGRAYGINNNGIAVGSVGSDVNEIGTIYNTVTGKTTMITAVSAEGSYMSTAWGISDNGIVAGIGTDTSSRNVALMYDTNTGKMTQLEMPAYNGYNTSLAFGISSNGEYVVGSSGNGSQSFIWSAATGTLLTPLPSISSGGGLYDVNSSGWGVGNSGGVYSNPFLYADGTTYLISDLIADKTGWNFATTTSASTRGIADDGSIIGTAKYNGIEHAFILTPVPEPGTYALMLVGLAGVGLMARRRSKV